MTGALRLDCFSLQELELLKRDFKNLEKDCSSLKEQMDIKDRLLQVNFSFKVTDLTFNMFVSARVH